MTKQGLQRTIPDVIENYKRSTVGYFSACDDENFAKQKIDMDRVNTLVEALDFFGAEGRLALIPLLDDADQGVRTFAAADLLKVAPERALVVLKEIQKGQTVFPRLSAGEFLDSYAEGKWGK